MTYNDNDYDFDEDDLEDLEDLEENASKRKISFKEKSSGRKPSKPKKGLKDIGGSNRRFILLIISITGSLLVFIFLIMFSIKIELFSKGKVGRDAVNYLYNYKDLAELESNLPNLSEITTEEVYNKISVTNSVKALDIYLKFKKGPVKVSILDSKPGYIYYTLESGTISSGRRFVFVYTIDWFGKIDSAREMETIDFYEEGV